MALVKEWISGFLKRHKALFGPNDWPSGEDAEDARKWVGMWITAFATRQVTEPEADEASCLLGPSPPNFRREHLPAVLAMVDDLRKRRGGSNGAVPDSREAAEQASRHCDDCGGRSGLTTRYHPAPDPANRIPATVQGYCGCPFGRWVKRQHADHNPEYLRCFVDVVDEQHKPVWWLREPLRGHSFGGYRYDREPDRSDRQEAAPRKPESEPEPAPPADPAHEAVNAMFTQGQQPF